MLFIWWHWLTIPWFINFFLNLESCFIIFMKVFYIVANNSVNLSMLTQWQATKQSKCSKTYLSPLTSSRFDSLFSKQIKLFIQNNKKNNTPKNKRCMKITYYTFSISASFYKTIAEEPPAQISKSRGEPTNRNKTQGIILIIMIIIIIIITVDSTN